MKRSLKHTLRLLLYPFPPSGLGPNQLYSPMDVVAERLGADMVERIMADDTAQRIERAFVHFLRDEGAGRCLRKGVHGTAEDCLRVTALGIDPPERHGFAPVPIRPTDHPLRKMASDMLRASTQQPVPQTSPPATGRLNAAAIAWGLAYLVHSAAVLFRFGKARVTPGAYRIASQDFWTTERWTPYFEALRERGIQQNDFVFVLERKDSNRYSASGYATLDPDSAAVPRAAWVAEAIMPGLILIFRVIAALIVGGRRPAVATTAWEALHQAYLTLRLRRMTYHLRVTSFLDIVEYNALHTLKAILFRPSGTQVVRLPHTEMDGGGANLSYLGYGIFLSGGDYQARNFGHSWDFRAKLQAVGLVQADKRAHRAERIDPTLAHAIDGQIAAGRRMAAFFGPSSVPGIEPVAVAMLSRIWSLVEERDDWFIVVKPKNRDDIYQWIKKRPQLATLMNHPRAVLVSYPESSAENCPAGWLIDRMTVGASIGGSVQIEALVARKLHIAYYPVLQRTSYKMALIENGLIFDDLHALSARLVGIMDNVRSPSVDFAWFQKNFDSFQDNDALGRVAEILTEAHRDRRPPFECKSRLSGERMAIGRLAM